jgi:hypothetical protein
MAQAAVEDTISATEFPSRRYLELYIETLIALLDTIDPDPDLEEEPDREPEVDREPLPGSLECVDQDHAWGFSAGIDCDLELDTADDEPSLASPEQVNQERAWKRTSGYDEDREVEHDGREPDEDIEHDPAEWGIADDGGLCEQRGRTLTYEARQDNSKARCDTKKQIAEITHRNGVQLVVPVPPPIDGFVEVTDPDGKVWWRPATRKANSPQDCERSA